MTAQDHAAPGTADTADTPARGSMLDRLVRHNGEPFEVGQLAVDPEGDVYPRPGDEPVQVRFVYQGVPFHATVTGDREVPLELTASPGVLPYSAETPAGRRAVLTLLKHAAPARGQLTLDREGRLHLRFAEQIPAPRTPVHVMATIASLLVEARPYLDLLRSARALGPSQDA